MTIVIRPSCWHKIFGPNGLSAPTLGLCLNFFSSITTDFNISSALRWVIQDQWSSGNGENDVYLFSVTMNSIFIKLTGNKDRHKIFGRVRISAGSDQSLELRAHELWKKWCLQLFSLTCDQIFVKLAGKEDRHKSSNELEFGPDQIIHFWSYSPLSEEFISPAWSQVSDRCPLGLVVQYCDDICRVGEEREQAVNQLHGERENYEKQLLTLVDQQEKILLEREGIIRAPSRENLSSGFPTR